MKELVKESKMTVDEEFGRKLSEKLSDQKNFSGKMLIEREKAGVVLL